MLNLSSFVILAIVVSQFTILICTIWLFPLYLCFFYFTWVDLLMANRGSFSYAHQVIVVTSLTLMIIALDFLRIFYLVHLHVNLLRLNLGPIFTSIFLRTWLILLGTPGIIFSPLVLFYLILIVGALLCTSVIGIAI